MVLLDFRSEQHHVSIGFRPPGLVANCHHRLQYARIGFIGRGWTMDAGSSCSPHKQVIAGINSSIRNQFDYSPGTIVSIFYRTNLVKLANRIESKIGRLSLLDDRDNPNIIMLEYLGTPVSDNS